MRAPLAEKLTAVRVSLGAFLKKIGPNMAPGFEAATPDEEWAEHAQIGLITGAWEVQMAMDRVLQGGWPEGDPSAFHARIEGLDFGSPPAVCLVRLYETFSRMLARWNIPKAVRGVAVEVIASRSYGVQPPSPEGDPGVADPVRYRVNFPTIATDEEYRILAWAEKTLRDRIGQPESRMVSPADLFAAGQERSPTVEQLEAIGQAVRSLLKCSGPMAIGGFAQGHPDDRDMFLQQSRVLNALRAIKTRLYAGDFPDDLPARFAKRIKGWPRDKSSGDCLAERAIHAIHNTFTGMLVRWNLDLYGDEFRWIRPGDQMPEGYEPPGLGEPGLRIITRPLTVDDYEHDKLSWAADRIAEAVAESGPERPTVATGSHLKNQNPESTDNTPKRKGTAGRKPGANAERNAWICHTWDEKRRLNPSYSYTLLAMDLKAYIKRTNNGWKAIGADQIGNVLADASSK